jgi:predicted SprT family Zn-dependent metalloprotease
MDIIQARILANQLIEFHGLKSKGWRFAFDDSLRHFGCCNYTKKVIFLSKPMVLTITEEKTQDTILHECAHAIVGFEHHHDEVWKKCAISIGCRGDRCSDLTKESISETRLEKFQKLKYKYTYICPTCNNITYSNSLYRNAGCKTGHDMVKYKIKKN